MAKEEFIHKNEITLNDDNIKNLVNSIFYVFLYSSIYSCTHLYILVRQFAKAFRDETRVRKAKKIWKGTTEENPKRQVSIPTIEIVLYRDLSFPFKIGKRYNVSLGKKNEFHLGGLNEKLQEAKEGLMDIFFDVYLENNVSVQFIMPSFTDKSTEGMPKL